MDVELCLHLSWTTLLVFANWKKCEVRRMLDFHWWMLPWVAPKKNPIKWCKQCHNIIQIHKSVMWDWQYCQSYMTLLWLWIMLWWWACDHWKSYWVTLCVGHVTIGNHIELPYVLGVLLVWPNTSTTHCCPYLTPHRFCGHWLGFVNHYY